MEGRYRCGDMKILITDIILVYLQMPRHACMAGMLKCASINCPYMSVLENFKEKISNIKDILLNIYGLYKILLITFVLLYVDV
jgi:hypothetical protein